MIATAIAAAGSNVPRAQAQEANRASANETIRHAVIGCRTRGRVHADEFGRQAGVEIAYVCDPDRQLADELAASVEKQQGRRPKAVQDLRAIFDDKSVDTVSIATPNHWHALAAIWAMQAGKDVYVEKPVSHNVSEGRRIVQVAREDRPDLPDRDAESLQHRPGRGGRVHPRGEARRRDVRAEHRLRPSRGHRAPR